MHIYLYKKSSFESEPFLAPLLETPNCPEELYVRGTLPKISKQTKVLTVIGSRKVTNYGKDALTSLLRGLQGQDVVIVSGLALGVDALAHRTALEVGLKTVALPGSGVSNKALYPKTNAPLAEQIISAGGAIISEYTPEATALLYMFPKRNRIMAGISQATLVIEAEEKSGTLITAKLATDYNRDVLTVPGSIFQSSSRGPHMLIRLGATPITSSQDLLEALGCTINTSQTVIPFDLTDNERLILDVLFEPQSKQYLLENLDMPITDILMNISLLEIKGLIKESLGKIYRV